MTKKTNAITERIARLNDAFRRSAMSSDSKQEFGQVVCTPSIVALHHDEVLSIRNMIKLFDDFNESNDPYGEHDFGSFTHKEEKVYWKIDYKDPNLEYQPEYLPQNHGENRILTIMFSHEW